MIKAELEEQRMLNMIKTGEGGGGQSRIQGHEGSIAELKEKGNKRKHKKIKMVLLGSTK